MKELYKTSIAALSFFTRLPFWRLTKLDKEDYKKVVPLWPLAGFITGGVMAAVSLMSEWLPIGMVAPLCIGARILMTGALHEDGFADFFDGFGGGYNRERILEIMKDSHIGTYGVLALVVYALIITNCLGGIICNSNGAAETVSALMYADIFSKYTSSTIIYKLPYARKEEESKNKLIYNSISTKFIIASFALTILPLIFIYKATSIFFIINIFTAMIASSLAAPILYFYMWKKIKGYTGDCCGATFIITETIFYATLNLMMH